MAAVIAMQALSSHGFMMFLVKAAVTAVTGLTLPTALHLSNLQADQVPAIACNASTRTIDVQTTPDQLDSQAVHVVEQTTTSCSKAADNHVACQTEVDRLLIDLFNEAQFIQHFSSAEEVRPMLCSLSNSAVARPLPAQHLIFMWCNTCRVINCIKSSRH